MSDIESQTAPASVTKALANGAMVICCGVAVLAIILFFSLSLVVISRELPLVMLGVTSIGVSGGALMVGAGVYSVAFTIMHGRAQ